MTKFSILGAAAVVATALASPAMAQEVIYNPGYCAQFYPNANCQNKGPGNPYTGDYQRRTAYRDSGYRQDWNQGWNNGWDQSWNEDRGFAPGNAFAYDNRNYGNGYDSNGVGYGAYAHSDYYANAHAGHGYNGIYGNSNNTYAARNGLVCEPGSIFRGEDGRRHRCQ
jgi:hypothetical protein